MVCTLHQCKAMKKSLEYMAICWAGINCTHKDGFIGSGHPYYLSISSRFGIHGILTRWNILFLHSDFLKMIVFLVLFNFLHSLRAPVNRKCKCILMQVTKNSMRIGIGYTGNFRVA